jgi:hypothetical protein
MVDPCEHDNVPLSSTEGRDFLEPLSDSQILKKNQEVNLLGDGMS